MTREDAEAFSRNLPYRPRIRELGSDFNTPRNCEDLYGPETSPEYPRWRWALLGAIVVGLAGVFVAVALSVPF